MDRAQEIATTTAQQLGGAGALRAMIGANRLTWNADGRLSFHFRLCRKANYVTIDLDQGRDSYVMTFYRVVKFDANEVEKFDELFGDDLRRVFEDFTGLTLTVPTIKRA